MPVVKFELAPRPRKDGRHSVYIRTIEGGKVVRHAIGLSLFPNEWDKDRQAVTSKFPGYLELNKDLKILADKVNRKIYGER
jgi:hypothetical protein